MAISTPDQLATAKTSLDNTQANLDAYRADVASGATKKNSETELSLKSARDDAKQYYNQIEASQPEKKAPPTTIIAPNKVTNTPVGPTTSTADAAVKPAENKTSVGEANTEQPLIFDNPLHQFASYTYDITLSSISNKQVGEIYLDPNTFTVGKEPGSVLIASAGRYPNSRAPGFGNDFYFDKLEFDTVIGMNAQTGSANAIMFNFSVIEPYGVTLLERIQALGTISKDKNDSKGSYTSMPYMLTIDFFGYPDSGRLAGQPVLLKNQSKHFPIIFTEFKFKVSTKGAEYQIAAIPFGHMAFNESVSTTPARFEVLASDLRQFFQANETNPAFDPWVHTADISENDKKKKAEAEAKHIDERNKQADATKQKQDELGRKSNPNYDRDQKAAYDKLTAEGKRQHDTAGILQAPTNSASNTTTDKDKALRAKSYTGALNAWNMDNYDEKDKQLADLVRFDIDKSILALGEMPSSDEISKDSGAYPIVKPIQVTDADKAELKQAEADLAALKARTDPPPTSDEIQSATANVNAAKDKVNPPVGSAQQGYKTENDPSGKQRVLMAINQGTSIIGVVDMALQSSKYIHNQLLNFYDKDAKISGETVLRWLNSTFCWYKVTPAIAAYGPWDGTNNRWVKKIVYRIAPFETANYNTDAAPSTPIPPKFIKKKYEYIFSGHNTDIINFDITYDSQFYTLTQTDPQKQESTNATPDGKKLPTLDINSIDANQNYTSEQVRSLVAMRIAGNPAFRPRRVKVAGVPGAQATTGVKSEITKEAARNVLSQPGGDMISLELKIVGDPDYIKQDDVFFDAVKHASTEPYLKGKLANGGSLVMDANEVYVELNFNTVTDYDKDGLARPVLASAFSGMYQIITVKNSFASGKFEQVLSLIRHPDMKDPKELAKQREAVKPADTGARTGVEDKTVADGAGFNADYQKRKTDNFIYASEDKNIQQSGTISDATAKSTKDPLMTNQISLGSTPTPAVTPSTNSVTGVTISNNKGVTTVSGGTHEERKASIRTDANNSLPI